MSDPAVSVTGMELRIVNVTVNTDRPRELAQWWAAALGAEITNDWGEFVTIGDGASTGMGFQYVEGTEPGRIHVDFASADAPATVKRLIDSGATHVADHEVPGGHFSWTVLADPDGNQFCIAAADAH